MFDPQCAVVIGVEKSILLHGIMYWILKNSANGKHHHEGRYWMYNSASAFVTFHPYWSDQKIKRMLQQLEEDGWIVSGNFNKVKMDRTKWYSITDQCISKNWTVHGLNLTNGKFRSDPPIPENTREDSENKQYLLSSPDGSSETSEAAVDVGEGERIPPCPPSASQEPKLPTEKGYDPKVSHTFTDKMTDHGCAKYLAEFLVDEASKAYGKKLIAKPSGSIQPIIKLFKLGVKPRECLETLKWLYTTNVSSKCSFRVESGDSLLKKWDRIQTQMANGGSQRRSRLQ